MAIVDIDAKIPNNVDLAGDRRLQRALEQWQPRFVRWWEDLGPAVFSQVEAMLDEQAQAVAKQGVVIDQQQLHGFDRTRFELVQMDESRHPRHTQLRGRRFASTRS